MNWGARSTVLIVLSMLATAFAAGVSHAATGDPSGAQSATVTQTVASAAQTKAVPVDAKPKTVSPTLTVAKTTRKAKPVDDAPGKAASVYLFRGFMGVFSHGMDEMQEKLEAKGIKTRVLPYTAWQSVFNEIVDEAKSSPKGRYPLVIMGHSLGANAALMLAYLLGEKGVPVNLVVTVDPTVSRPVTPTVRRYINIYQANNGLGVAIDGKGISPKRLENYNTWDHANLTKPGVTHFTLDKTDEVQQKIFDAVMRALKR